MSQTHRILYAVVILTGLWLSAPIAHARTPVNPDLTAQIRPLYTTANDPALHTTSPGQGFDGVAQLILQRSDGTFLCSGTLLSNGKEILTAAHCLTDNLGSLVTNNVTASFQLSTGSVSLSSSNITVHPDWDGDFSFGNDLALITLNDVAPADIPRHDIYRASDEVGQVVTKVGYGRSGNGNDGDVLGAGIKRSGFNTYDALGDVLDAVGGIDPLPGAQLAYDFDDGTVEHDAFGFFDTALGVGNLSHLGVGDDEVMSAPGDSGGPTFINGLVAGITSYGLRLDLRGGRPPRTSDVDKQLNSTFGEFGVDTRVSFFADWIDANISFVSPPTPTLAGDLDGNGFVDILDLNIVLAEWNSDGSNDPRADTDGDGLVDILDLNVVLTNWNLSTPPSLSGTSGLVPEPATLGLMVLAGAGATLRRRR